MADGGASPNKIGVVPTERAGLVGREPVVAELVRAVREARQPLIVLSGEAGSGRSAVLEAVPAQLTDVRVLKLNAGEHDLPTTFGALYRLLAELDESGHTAAGARSSLLSLVAGLSGAPSAEIGEDTAEQLAMAVLVAARRHLPLVVVVDDAQWLDDATVTLLEPVVRRMAGAPMSLLLSVRSDARREGAEVALRRLREAGLARIVTMRPLTRRESRRIIAETVRANPDPGLVDELHGVSRGLPAALIAGIDGYRDAQALRIVDRHAFLVPSRERPVVADGHPLLAPVRDTGPAGWSVARAMSVLCPLGADAARLAAEGVDADGTSVLAALETLTRQRVLVRAGKGWRFRIPMVRSALEACLGPFERRRLSALAATAVWDGTAHTDDPAYLPDRLADAGKLVDPQRASQELLTRGWEALPHDGSRATRWLGSAATKAVDPKERAVAMSMHILACAIHNHTAEAVENARVLFGQHADQLEVHMLHSTGLAYLMSLAGAGEHAELRRVADGEDRLLPRERGQQTVSKAFALGWLDRWGDGRALLAAHHEVWSGGDPVIEDQANVFRIGAAVIQGDGKELFRFLAEPEHWRNLDVANHRLENIRHEANLLLALGELHRAAEVLESHDLGVEQLSHDDQFMVGYLRGDWARAMDAARRSMATSLHPGRSVGWAMLHWRAAQVHTAGGRLSRARQLIEAGRRGPLPHLFEFAEARVLRALGEHDAADDRVRRGVDEADAAGNALGTEEMWAELGHRAHVLGDADAAREALARLEKLSDRMGTGRAELAHLVTRARVLRDAAAADAAVDLVRKRGQPHETSVTFARIARAGFRATELLPEAYRLAGRLDALLLRSRMRALMRECTVPVPNKAATTSENERLLAVLVTEGMSNRQIASVVGATEKSVEGRLTRMFARIGYRSRVELAAAMLTGGYPG